MWNVCFGLLLEALSGEEGLSSDWLPGALLVVVLVGLWLLWRRARAAR